MSITETTPKEEKASGLQHTTILIIGGGAAGMAAAVLHGRVAQKLLKSDGYRRSISAQGKNFAIRSDLGLYSPCMKQLKKIAV